MQLMKQRTLSFWAPRPLALGSILIALAASPAAAKVQVDGEGQSTEMIEDPDTGGLDDTELGTNSAAASGALSSDAGGPAAGTWGLGGIITASGIGGVELEYYLSSAMISAVLGFGFYSPDGADTESELSFAVGGFLPLRQGSNAALSIGGRLGLVRSTNSIVMTSYTQTSIAIEVPLRAEWWVSPNFSLHLEAGAVLRLNSTDPDGRGGTQLDLGTGNVAGSAGFTVVF